MTKRQRIEAARARVDASITAFSKQSRMAAELASEGFDGGYRAALDDVLLLLNGVTPRRNGWWKEGE